MKIRIFLFCLIIHIVTSGLKTLVPAQTINLRTSIAGFESGVTLKAGAYKSYANSFFLLQHRQSTKIYHPNQEAQIYRQLISRVLTPRYVVFQATVFPLVFGSSQIETYHPAFYQKFEVMGMNLLRSVGSGYTEPYSLSLLVGNVALFGYKYQDGDNRVRVQQSGSALAGLMLTGSHLHVQDNIQVHDRWWQPEFILTGALNEPERRVLHWNFRLGVKIHETPLTPDVFVVVLHRSHTEWNFRKFSILRNARIHYEFHIPIGDDWGRLPFTVRQHFSYGKKFPFKAFGRWWALRIGGGFIWEWIRLFDHNDRIFEQQERSKISWLIQPSIEF